MILILLSACGDDPTRSTPADTSSDTVVDETAPYLADTDAADLPSYNSADVASAVGGFSQHTIAGQLPAPLLCAYLMEYSVVVDPVGIMTIAAGAAQRTEGAHRGCKLPG